MGLDKQLFDKRNLFTFKRFRWLFCSLLLTSFLSVLSFTPHPYHVSYTEIFYKKEVNQITFSIEVFTDDLETALKLDSKAEKIFLGGDSIPDTTDSLIQSYFLKHTKVIIDGIILKQISFLPTESNPDRTTIYFEVTDLPQFQSFVFYNEILIYTLPDQQNIVEFNYSGIQKKALFTKSKTNETWIVK